MSRSFSRSLTAVTAVAIAATGCAMMMKSMTPTPRTATNPLVSGQPLEATKNARIGTVGEKDCDRWPFEDTVSVSVSEAQICVSVRKHVEQPPGWSGEPTANSSDPYSVRNDAGEGGSITVEKAHAAKVATCFEPGYKANIGVWAFDYKGCAPNNGTVGKMTKSLTVGDESWSFAGAAATEPPAGT